MERAVTYRDKKIKPLFIEMKNKIGAMAAQVKELTRERDKWKSKFQKKKQEHENTKKELAEVQKDYQKLSGEKEILQGIADRYNRLLRMLGEDMVERLVQDDIRMQAELEAMPESHGGFDGERPDQKRRSRAQRDSTAAMAPLNARVCRRRKDCSSPPAAAQVRKPAVPKRVRTKGCMGSRAPLPAGRT